MQLLCVVKAGVMARPEGLEPPTYRFEVCRSIQLSYGRAPIPKYYEACVAASAKNAQQASCRAFPL